MTEARKPIDCVERLEEAIAEVRTAQKAYAVFTQDQVDQIFFAAAMAANRQRIPLAKLAKSDIGKLANLEKILKAKIVGQDEGHGQRGGSAAHHRPYQLLHDLLDGRAYSSDEEPPLVGGRLLRLQSRYQAGRGRGLDSHPLP